jgi:hypothetical protein
MTANLTAERDEYSVKIVPVDYPWRKDWHSDYFDYAKIPDPLVLSDGNDLRFDDWLLLMRQKPIIMILLNLK